MDLQKEFKEEDFLGLVLQLVREQSKSKMLWKRQKDKRAESNTKGVRRGSVS